MQLSQRFQIQFRPWDLRNLYKKNRITKQRMVSRLGGKKLKHPTFQEDLIIKLRERLSQLKDDGYDILQSDECLFSADSYVSSHWAPSGNPMRKTTRFTGYPKVVVCGVISPVTGKVHFKYGIRSFNAMDMIEVLKGVRKEVGPKAKVAIMWDNASIH